MRKTKRSLAWLLAVIMILAVTACNASAPSSNEGPATENEQTKATDTPSADAPAAEQQTKDDIMKPFAPYDEPVTLTFARHLNLGGQLAEGETTSDNVFIDVIKEKLNIDCVIAWETTPDDYRQKLALNIAGDTLPDVFGLQDVDYLLFQQLVEEGKLADLTEAYNNCIGGIDAEYLKALDGSQLTASTFDGKIMGIPNIPTGYNYNLLWVRSDWLEKVGMDVPKTVEDIKAVALAFIEHKLGGENTVGIVVDPQTILKTSHSFLSFSTVANSQNAYPGSWIFGPDGKAVYGSVAPEMKDALAVVADWYAAGIMDPQFMTYQNMDAVTPAIREGNCGMYFGAYWSPWTVADSRKVDPEMEWVMSMAPVDKDGKFNHINPIDANNWLLVSSKCQNPEAVIKAANVANELERGAYNNEPHIKEAVDKSKAAGSFGRTISPFAGANYLSNMFDHEAQMGIGIRNYIETGKLELFVGASESDYDNAQKAYNWFQNPDDRNDIEGYSLYNSFTYMAEVYESNINHDEPIAYPYSTPSMADYWGVLETMEKEMITLIVSGQKPLDYFDEFVNIWKQSGGDIITQEVNDIIGR